LEVIVEFRVFRGFAKQMSSMSKEEMCKSYFWTTPKGEAFSPLRLNAIQELDSIPN